MDVVQELIALHESDLKQIAQMQRLVQLIVNILNRLDALEAGVVVNAGEYYDSSKGRTAQRNLKKSN